jgi:hypothetical protein
VYEAAHLFFFFSPRRDLSEQPSIQPERSRVFSGHRGEMYEFNGKYFIFMRDIETLKYEHLAEFEMVNCWGWSIFNRGREGESGA